MNCVVCTALAKTRDTGMLGRGAREDAVAGTACAVTVYVLARCARDGSQRVALCQYHQTTFEMLDEPGGPFRANDGTERPL